MGCTKSSAKREVYSNTSLPQEIRKLQANITDELRCKNPQQNSSKHIPKTHLKGHIS